MRANNNVNLIGHLGQDPEKKQFANGGSIVAFNLAVTERFKKNEETVTKTHWLRCVVYGLRGDTIMKYTKKGDKISLCGSIAVDQYKDKDGNSRTSTYIKVSDFHFLSNQTNSKTEASIPSAQNNTSASDVDQSQDDDLPF